MIWDVVLVRSKTERTLRGLQCYRCVQKRNAPYGVCNVIGAIKNGAHLRRGGFASQILLSPDLTYRGLLVNMVLIVGQELFNVENL